MMSALALTLTELNVDGSVFFKYFDMYKKYHLCGFVQRFYSFIFMFMMNDKISFQMQRSTTQFSVQQPYNPAHKPTSKHWPKPKEYRSATAQTQKLHHSPCCPLPLSTEHEIPLSTFIVAVLIL